jgi:hypothetical protein
MQQKQAARQRKAVSNTGDQVSGADYGTGVGASLGWEEGQKRPLL